MTAYIPTLISICFPAVLQLICGMKYDIKKRDLWLSAAAIAIIANSIALGATCFLGSWYTVYEQLLVCAILSVFLVMILFPVIKKRHINHLQILATGCILCICVAVYSILTYGQILIHSDTATASLLTNAQLTHGAFFPESWCYVNGDIWILTIQIFTAPFVILLQNQSLARMLGSAFLLLVTIGIMVWHSKKAFSDNSWVISIPILLLYIHEMNDMTLYQAAYTDQIIFLLVSSFLLFQIYNHYQKATPYLVYSILTVLLVASGIRYLAELVIPLWLTCIVMDYVRIRNQNSIEWSVIIKNWFRMSLFIMIPVAIGYFFHRWISSFCLVVNTDQNSLQLASSIRECLDNVLTYVINLFTCFGFKGSASLVSLDGIMSMASVLMCSLVVFVIPVLQAVKIKKEKLYVQFFFAFSVIHNLIMFVLAVFFVGKTLPHYLLTSIFLSVILSARYIFVYWICQAHFDKYLWTVLFVIATAVGCLTLLSRSANWYDSLSYTKATVQQLAEHGLTKGYGDFWNTYTYEVYSDFTLQFGAVAVEDDRFIPHLWLVDKEVFEPEDTQTFLLISEEENQAVAPIIQRQFRKPVDYFTIENYHVYVFDYDIAVDLA